MCSLTLEVIRQCAVDSLVQPRWAPVDLVVMHVGPAGDGAFIHPRILLLLLLLRPVPLHPVLRVTVLHYQDALSSHRRVVVGEAR